MHSSDGWSEGYAEAVTRFRQLAPFAGDDRSTRKIGQAAVIVERLVWDRPAPTTCPSGTGWPASAKPSPDVDGR